jgi:hypothetical protein
MKPRRRKEIEEKIGPDHGRYLDEIILEIGRDAFTRRDLTRLGIPFFRAAMILHNQLEGFRPKSVKELAGRVNLGQVYVQGLGKRAMTVWFHVLEARGVDSMAWLNDEHKLSTIKQRLTRSRR